MMKQDQNKKIWNLFGNNEKKNIFRNNKKQKF